MTRNFIKESILSIKKKTISLKLDEKRQPFKYVLYSGIFGCRLKIQNNRLTNSNMKTTYSK